MQAHRGGRLSALAAALLEVLDPTQSSQPKLDAETTDAGIQTHVEVMDRAVQMESAKSSSITGENDHQAEIDSAVLMESSKSSAITGKNEHQLMESSTSSAIIGKNDHQDETNQPQHFLLTPASERGAGGSGEESLQSEPESLGMQSDDGIVSVKGTEVRLSQRVRRQDLRGKRAMALGTPKKSGMVFICIVDTGEKVRVRKQFLTHG